MIGSTQMSSFGMPRSLAWETVSMMLSIFDSTSGGIPLSVMTEITTSQLYFFANGSIWAFESLFPDAELIKALFLQNFNPASMATGFMVSTDKGKSVASWTQLTSHFMVSSVSFFMGPTFKSI